MKSKVLRFLQNIDWPLLITPILIASFGLLELYSIALGSGSAADFGQFRRQLLFAGVGLAAYLLIAGAIDYRALNRYSMVFYVGTVIMLVTVLILGRSIRGTTGWFNLGGFSLQPIEFAKIFLIIFLARFLTQKAKYIQNLKYLLSSGAGVFLLVMLVLLQPDFGSAVILLSIWAGLLLMTGLKKSHLLILMVSFLAATAVLWFFVFANYQKERIRIFLDPSLDPLGRGYNVTQAIIAVGSGQWFGRGLGFGSQSQLKFLPEAQTDFIFAVIAEELGLVGVLILFGLYSVLFWRLISIALHAQDNFGLYVVLGITILIFVELMVNVSGNLGLLPVTGIALPLVSYGGSSLVATMILLGIAQAVAVRRS